MSEIHNLPRGELMKRVYFYEKKYGPYIEKKGLHNWRNLFRKPTLYEWVILVMILMAVFMGLAYSSEISNSFKNGYSTCYYQIYGINYNFESEMNGINYGFEVENDLVE